MSLYKNKKYNNTVLTDILDKCNKFGTVKKIFISLSAIYIIALFALIRANFNYIDDLGRVASGYAGWDNFSRYTSCYLSYIVHAGIYLTDISPISQLIAVCILAGTSVIVLKVINKKEIYSLWEVIAVIPLGLSPYYLECLSYKYDSPYMALSILASVFPVLLCKKRKCIYIMCVIFCTIIMCTTYQPSSGIFPMLITLLCAKAWNNKEEYKDILKFIASSVIGYIVGILIFYTFIMKTVDTYVSTEIASPRKIIENYILYFNTIKSDFKQSWLILIVLIFLGFFWTMIKESKHNKIVAFVISIVTLGCMLFLSWGLYPALSIPLTAPRALYGFGVCIAFISIATVSNKNMYFFKVICLILGWCFIVFASTYGNALAVQNEYTNFRIQMVIDDLNSINLFNSYDVKNVQIAGNIGKSPILNNMPQNYQILNRLVPTTFGSDWMWNNYKFYNYYGLKNIVNDTSIDLRSIDLPIIKDTMY